MPKSKKAKSTGSLSTTQETGKLYELTFSEGFTLQNNKSILHGDWMTAYEGIKFYRKNGDPHGDIDFLCRTTEELKDDSVIMIIGFIILQYIVGKIQCVWNNT